MKMKGLPIKLLCFCFCLISLQSKAQETLYYDQNYDPVKSQKLARFMEVKKCAADDGNKCSIDIYALDKKQLISSRNYSNYAERTLHGQYSRWNYDGALLMETRYENGRKQGIQRCYYTEGKLKKELQWDNDTVVTGALYLDDGTLLKQVNQEDVEDGMIIPMFPGGPKAMYKYLAKTVEYPREAVEKGYSGQVVLTFLVAKSGEISEIEVRKSPHPSLDGALVAAIKKMPLWEPGRLDGVPMPAHYTLPFKFQLN